MANSRQSRQLIPTLIVFGIVLFVITLAWNNPPGNPPEGEGVISVDSGNRVNIATTTLVRGELRTPDPSDEDFNRIWGEGRTTSLDTTAADCSNGGIHAALSAIPAQWGDVKSACPAEWWICYGSEFDTARGGGTCGAGLSRTRFSCAGASASDNEYWIASGNATQAKGNTKKPDGTGNTHDVCSTRRVWCCAL